MYIDEEILLKHNRGWSQKNFYCTFGHSKCPSSVIGERLLTLYMMKTASIAFAEHIRTIRLRCTYIRISSLDIGSRTGIKFINASIYLKHEKHVVEIYKIICIDIKKEAISF